ncbi:LamG-like jellyroll fold domain-containing protein, partial [Lacticaseibacillus paracasei]
TDWSSFGNDRGDIIYSGHNGFRVRGGSNRLEFSNDFFGTPIAGSADNSIKLNQWNFVSVTRNSAGQVTFYVNGVLSGTPN